MKTAFTKNPNDVRKDKIAQLIDRIRIHEGKKQLFGTQWRYDKNNIFRPYPIYNPKQTEKRRKEYDLEPFKKFFRWAKTNPPPKPIPSPTPRPSRH